MKKTMRKAITPTGFERTFADDQFIVSKTDLKGRLLYGNRLFIDLSGYPESEILGKPHNIIRHPEMPKTIFQLLWDRLQNEKEIFAYVNNMSQNGDNYWVNAHVTPSFNAAGAVLGYHSTRRTASSSALDIIKPLYSKLIETERKAANTTQAMADGIKILNTILAGKGIDYDEFILSI